MKQAHAVAISFLEEASSVTAECRLRDGCQQSRGEMQSLHPHLPDTCLCSTVPFSLWERRDLGKCENGGGQAAEWPFTVRESPTAATTGCWEEAAWTQACHRSHLSHPVSEKINRACPEAQGKGYKTPKSAWASEAEKYGRLQEDEQWSQDWKISSICAAPSPEYCNLYLEKS